MRRFISLLLILFLILAAGCASHKYRIAYRKGADQYSYFKDLNDEQALETVVLIFNLDTTNRRDEMAKSLTIEEYMEALRERNSKPIEESGVFELVYEKIELTTWKDQELIDYFNYLDSVTSKVKIKPIIEGTTQQNVLRVVHMTALEAVSKEGQRRDTMRGLRQIALQALNIALNVAMAVL